MRKRVLSSLLVMVSIMTVMLCGCGSKKKNKGEEATTAEDVVSDFMNAFEKADGKKMVKFMLPKDMQEDIFGEWDNGKEGYIEHMEDKLDDIWEEVETEDMKFSWEIKEAESLEKLDKLKYDVAEQWSVESLDDYIDYADDMYGDGGLDADKIKDAYAVKVKMTMESDDEKERNTVIFLVYKYSGNWYVDMSSINYMF